MNKVLNFHAVGNMEWFDNVISYLKMNYKLVGIETLHDYFQQKVKLKNVCHITIDDGDTTFFHNIYPVLKKYGVPASLYVSPSKIMERTNYWFQEIDEFDNKVLTMVIQYMFDIPSHLLKHFSAECILKNFRIKDIECILEKYMSIKGLEKKSPQNITVDQLLEIHNYGLVVVGAHTMRHPILSNELTTDLKYEIECSIKGLAKLLQHDVSYFSYPNGIPNLDFSSREQSILHEAGIKLAFSTAARNFNISDNIMSIPRIGITDNENMPYLKTKLAFGSYWESLSKCRPSGEYVQRRKIRKIFSDHMFFNRQ